MSQPPVDRGRREVLGRTGSVAVAGAAVAVLGPAANARPTLAPAAPAPKARPAGYRETERMRRYYELARF